MATDFRELTLFTPLSVAAVSRIRGSALARLLARGSGREISSPSEQAFLAALFGLAESAGEDLPVAAITRVADTGERDDSWWIRADPVHLTPAADRLILAVDSVADLSAGQGDALARALASRVKEEDWLLEAPVPRRWYLRVEPGLRLRTFNPARVRSRHIDPWLPRGEDAPRWQILLNELQMMLYGLEANREREAEGLVPVNSLWLWGGGRLPAVPTGTWAGVWSADPLARGLGMLAQIPVRDIPGVAIDWDAWIPGRHLMVLDGSADGRAALEALEKVLSADIFPALEARALSAVTLIAAGDERAIHLERRQLRRSWWRR